MQELIRSDGRSSYEFECVSSVDDQMRMQTAGTSAVCTVPDDHETVTQGISHDANATRITGQFWLKPG